LKTVLVDELQDVAEYYNSPEKFNDSFKSIAYLIGEIKTYEDFEECLESIINLVKKIKIHNEKERKRKMYLIKKKNEYASKKAQ